MVRSWEPQKPNEVAIRRAIELVALWCWRWLLRSQTLPLRPRLLVQTPEPLCQTTLGCHSRRRFGSDTTLDRYLATHIVRPPQGRLGPWAYRSRSSNNFLAEAFRSAGLLAYLQLMQRSDRPAE